MSSQPINIHRIFRGLAIIAFVTLFTLAAGAKAQEQRDATQSDQECRNQTLVGSYGYSFSGFSGPYAITTYFFAEGRVGAVGVASFDGLGNITAQDALARTGTPAIRHTGAGTYTVNPNCIGHASIDLVSDPNATAIDREHVEFDLTIVPGIHGREFAFIVTNQAFCTDGAACTPVPTQPVQTGVALSVGDEACSDASLQGSYRLLSTGTKFVAPPNVNANVGYRTFDGAGLITDGQDTGFKNDVSATNTGRTGTYSVYPDCTATETRSDGATFFGVVVDEGQQAYFLGTGKTGITIVLFKKGPGSFVMRSSDAPSSSDDSVDDDSGDD